MKTSILIFSLLATQIIAAAKIETKVQWRGELKKIMHAGDISATIDLDSLAGVPHFYALGAVAQLKGEILVLDGSPFVASVVDDSLKIDTTFHNKAALLVFAQVQNWQKQPVADSISTIEQFETYLPVMAALDSLDSVSPFPFLITGTVKSADWHVIDWPEGDSVHTPEKHRNSGLSGTISNQEVIILGFYSSKHHGIFTHHSSNLHMHIITADRKLAGHLDALSMTKGATLYFPK